MNNTKHSLGKSFLFAFKGLKFAFSERNFRIHIILGLISVLLGFLFRINHLEWLALVSCIAFVLTAETINTAIEKTLDLLHPDFNPLAGKIKDLSAAAVLLAAAGSIITGMIIFVPKIYNWLS